MIPAPHGAYVVSIEHRRKDGTTYSSNYPVVAFNAEGIPLLGNPDGAYGTGLVRPYDVRDVVRWCLQESETPPETIPAEPGWYALVRYKDSFGGDDSDERYPVVAWRPSRDEYGGSAAIIMHDGDSAGVVDAVISVKDVGNIALVGFFHPERYPEPVSEEAGI